MKRRFVFSLYNPIRRIAPNTVRLGGETCISMEKKCVYLGVRSSTEVILVYIRRVLFFCTILLFNIAYAPETTEKHGYAPKRTAFCERSFVYVRS